MISQETLDWSQSTATTLLSSLGKRWLHVQQVVRTAERIAPILSELDRPYLLAAAYLHDIGYAHDLVETGFHPLDGAHYIASYVDRRLTSLVAHHSGARFTARLLHLGSALQVFPREQSALSEALNYCDVVTGPQGQPCTLRERYVDILQRYGPDDPIFRSFEQAYSSLELDVKRTEKRLRLHGLG
jgi:hypothetical protein